MTKLTERIQEAGGRWGLTPRPGLEAVFGVKDGLLVQMAPGRVGNQPAFVGVVRWGDPQKDAGVRERLEGSEALKAAGVKIKQVNVTDGLAAYTLPYSFGFSLPSAEDLAARMRALAAEVKLVVGTPPSQCTVCRAVSVPEPVLVNGVVDRVCAGCVQKMEADARALEESYEALPTRWTRALLVGGALAVLGAVVWDAVLFFTNRMFWLLAIAIGAAIGWATTKAAGKAGRAVQILSGALTVASVAGGMLVIFFLAALNGAAVEGGVDGALLWANFKSAVASSIKDVLFAAGGGLIGAAVAAQQAARPKIAITVQK